MELDEHIYIGFYTATILEWKKLLYPDKYKEIIINSLKFLCEEKRTEVYGFVIMPNHIHLLWKVIPPYTLEQVQRSFMKFTSQMIKFDLVKEHPKVLEKFYVGAKDRKYQFWERNPKTKFLNSREVVEQKLNYIHNNPLQERWNLASNPCSYKFSSAKFYEEGNNEYGFLTHYMACFE